MMRGVWEILTMKLSLLLDRYKVSDRNTKRILIVTTEALVGSTDKFKVSKTAIHEKGRVLRLKYTKKILERINISGDDIFKVVTKAGGTADDRGLDMYSMPHGIGSLKYYQYINISNTCTILEHISGREVHYLAWRHHILQVMLRSVFECVFGLITGSYPDIFKIFHNT